MRRRSAMPNRACLLFIAALAFPFVPGLPGYWSSLGCSIGIAAIIGMGLVVLTGFGGMTSFAQATFMGFGAYSSAYATTQLGLSPWMTLPLALAVAGTAAALIGAITIRLAGHYLALGTIAWSVSFYYVFANLDLTGRNDGISGIPPLTIGSYALIDTRPYFIVVAVAMALSAAATCNLLDSRVGRAIRALNGGAGAAASCGVDTTAIRMLAFVYAGVLAGFAGWLYAHLQRSVNPTPFGLNAGIQYLLMAIVGGIGSLWGALLGAALVVLAQNWLQDLLPKIIGGTGNYETIVFGILLVAILQLAPRGLWPLVARTRSARPAASATTIPALATRRRPAAGSPLLAVKGLRKAFGGLIAVDNVDLDLRCGEIVGLIGPNGAGKSTTFNLLTGIAETSGGEISYLGERLARLGPAGIARRGIARSFQHVKLVADMSVIENVALGAHLRGRAGALRALLHLERREEAQLFAEATRQLDRVGLAGLAEKPAGTIALGQQRVVEIARALCLDPILLLLDEPAAGLRYAEKQELSALLQKLRAEGLSILIVEHDMDFVMRLTDRLIVMEFGRKLAEGAAAEIRADPAVIEAYLGSVA